MPRCSTPTPTRFAELAPAIQFIGARHATTTRARPGCRMLASWRWVKVIIESDLRFV